MKRIILTIGALSVLNTQIASAKLKPSLAITTGVAAVIITVGVLKQPTNGNAAQSDNAQTSQPQSKPTQSQETQSDKTNTQSTRKENLIALEDDYFAYLQDYKTALASGANFEIDDIKQPYIKEVVSNIVNDKDLIAKIETEVEGTSTLDKVNQVLTTEFLSL